MKSWKITADSTCDLSDDLLKKYDIELMGLKVILGDKEYIDRYDITPNQVIEFANETKTLPKTAARNQLDYQEMFEKHIKEGKKVLHISLSDSVSMSHRSAVLASEELNREETNVYVVNSKTLSLGSGIMAVAASEMLEIGVEISEVASKIERYIDKISTSFCVDTLEYLHKGGRCSSVELLGANILNIRPHIRVENGGLAVHKKYRGRMQKVISKYVQTLKNESNPDTSRCFVGHCNCDEKLVKTACEELRNQMGFKEIIVQNVGCVITSHCGVGTLGIGFVNQ